MVGQFALSSTENRQRPVMGVEVAPLAKVTKTPVARLFADGALSLA